MGRHVLMLTLVVAGLLAGVALGSAQQGRYASDELTCPPRGEHHSGDSLLAYDSTSDEGLRNRAKRHIPSGQSPKTLSLEDFAELQADVDEVTGVSAAALKTRFEPTRNALQKLKVGVGTVSEGDLVQLAAVLTTARDEHDESVNCEGTDGFDIHVNLGPGGPTPSEYEGVVVEMIPQLPRARGWDSHTLKSLRGREVLVVGGLTYDNEHLVNKDPEHSKSGQPARISLWEIHPITEFYVCPAVTCDANDLGQWVSLSVWAAQHP